MSKRVRRTTTESPALGQLEAVQLKLEALNDEAAQKVMEIEAEYNIKRRPFFDDRQKLIDKIPGFWRTAMLKSDDFSSLLTPEDAEVLKHLISIDCTDFSEVVDGFRITFKFSENDWFQNEELWKEFRFTDEGQLITSSGIEWKPGKDYIRSEAQEDTTVGEKRKQIRKVSLFTFFTEDDEILSTFQEDIGDLIKEELWMNPLGLFADGKLTVEEETPQEWIETLQSDGDFTL